MHATKILLGVGARCAGALLCVHALVGVSATTNIFVGANGTLTFSPSQVTIAPGDTIIWTWQGNFHSTTSGTPPGTPNGLWDSGVNSQPHSFTNTFASTGAFPFYCSVHFGSGMTGVVTVAAPNQPPTVSISSPTNGTTFSAPASFTLTASASDPDDAVTGVQFFQGTTSLGTVASSPYTVPVNNLAAADYTFSAVAADSSGLTATNAVMVHVVTAVPIVLSSPQRTAPADFQFTYTANAGLTYVVRRASSLSLGTWTNLATNQASSSLVSFDDTNATLTSLFYRVDLLPNP